MKFWKRKEEPIPRNRYEITIMSNDGDEHTERYVKSSIADGFARLAKDDGVVVLYNLQHIRRMQCRWI